MGIDAEEFRSLMARWVTGVAVVTGAMAGRPVGCTVNAFTPISLAPPLLLISLKHDSHTLAAIREQGAFGINMLALTQSRLGHRFARGSRDERFAGVDYHWMMGIPMLADAMIGMVCAVQQELNVADHALLVAEALLAERAGGAADDPEPAVFFRRAYWRLADLEAETAAIRGSMAG
jgi:flavin reductase (DIM6/NTAB) family NADH-FMN oxidoreductase RutF